VEVLRFQQDLSEAKLAEGQGRGPIAYVAQTRLWRATGMILEKDGIELQTSN
jgi:hypothetical protein